MEQDKKNVIKLIGIMIIYILLSALGSFSQIEVVLLPIVAVPFALYCMRNKITLQLQVIFHVAVSVAVYFMTQSLIGILIYAVSVVIPAYIILVLYKRELPLPNIIMNGGLILAVVVFCFLTLVKQLGFDYEAQYCTSLDLLANEFKLMFETVDELGVGVANSGMQITPAQINQSIDTIMLVLKKFYGTIIVSQVVMAFAVSVLLVNIIARRKNKTLPSTKQILEYRISKVAVLLLVICMLVADVNNSSDTLTLLALNMLAFLASLLQIAGILSLIALLKCHVKKAGIRILGYMGVIVLFMLWPDALLFYGCLDALFNYRKVEIVV